ncbi:Rieske (2Fe-2S) protein [Methanococcoides sp.]|uniref:Rieske (2Fe-2S) protein n=1 Tax=Methanococcoides sp. TaxID=1966350 RepID=UPI0019E95D44|nr:Rieske (2Fe-2S) protein [Methanococcoides sp.]NOQ48756.1 Rieske 2Fe-2S domain-containing protein [Methanococcoides sp.]
MTGYTELCSSDDVQDGEMRSFSSGDNKILVVNLGGKFYAIDAICNHMGGKLVGGKLKDNIVICPRHRCEYDVTSGKIKKKRVFLCRHFPANVMTRYLMLQKLKAVRSTWISEYVAFY